MLHEIHFVAIFHSIIKLKFQVVYCLHHYRLPLLRFHSIFRIILQNVFQRTFDNELLHVSAAPLHFGKHINWVLSWVFVASPSLNFSFLHFVFVTTRGNSELGQRALISCYRHHNSQIWLVDIRFTHWIAGYSNVREKHCSYDFNAKILENDCKINGELLVSK